MSDLKAKVRARWARISHGYRYRRGQAGRILSRPLPPPGADRGWRVTRYWDPIYGVLVSWLQTRERRSFLLGLPALLTVVVAASGALIVTGRSPVSTRNTHLLRVAEVAMATKDYSAAAVAYQRLLQVGDPDAATRFGLARCWAALGEREQALQLLASLAPDDGKGYPEAHRIRAYLLMEPAGAPPAQLGLARRHLEFALSADPGDTEAHGMLATLLMGQGDLAGARDHFAMAAGERPAMALNAAVMSRKLDDLESAAQFAQQAESHFRGMIHDKKAPPADSVIALAQALCLESHFGDAMSVLEEHMTGAHQERYRKALLDVCTSWQQALDQDDGPKDMDRLRVVRMALTYLPDSQAWQERLLRLAEPTCAARDKAILLLEQLARDKQAGPQICFYLGMEAWSHDDLPSARALLERALVLAPGHGPTANNLACAYLAGKETDAARALELADLAIRAEPKNPKYRETRGEALIVLGRWGEAAQQLEQALKGLQFRRNAHQRLALTYEKLGEPEKAREQLRLALQETPR